MEKPERKILYNEQGLTPGSPYEKGQWQKIGLHTDHEIKGFFGKYRFLSNFWPAKVFLDGEEYQNVENAYQAAKYTQELREKLKNCSAEEAKVFSIETPINLYSKEEWDKIKLEVMRKLLEQKFAPELNLENFEKLKETGDKYLEETNYWKDTFWGVYKTDASQAGIGENNLGKLLMEIRKNLQKDSTLVK